MFLIHSCSWISSKSFCRTTASFYFFSVTITCCCVCDDSHPVWQKNVYLYKIGLNHPQRQYICLFIASCLTSENSGSTDCCSEKVTQQPISCRTQNDRNLNSSTRANCICLFIGKIVAAKKFSNLYQSHRFVPPCKAHLNKLL